MISIAQIGKYSYLFNICHTSTFGLKLTFDIKVTDSNGNAIAGNISYSVKDLDMASKQSVWGRQVNTSDDAYNKLYAEGLEINSGSQSYAVVPNFNHNQSINANNSFTPTYPPLKVTSGTKLGNGTADGVKFSSATFMNRRNANGTVIGTAPGDPRNDADTFDTGFAVLLDASKTTMTWIGSHWANGQMSTKLFDSSAFTYVEQSHGTGGGIYLEGYNISNNCSTVMNEGAVTMAYHDSVTLTAVPEDGYRVDTIRIGDVGATGTVYTVVYDKDGNATGIANASGTETSLTNGKATVDGFEFEVNSDGTVDITLPDVDDPLHVHVDFTADYYFYKVWKGGNPTELKMTAAPSAFIFTEVTLPLPAGTDSTTGLPVYADGLLTITGNTYTDDNGTEYTLNSNNQLETDRLDENGNPVTDADNNVVKDTLPWVLIGNEFVERQAVMETDPVTGESKPTGDYTIVNSYPIKVEYGVKNNQAKTFTVNNTSAYTTDGYVTELAANDPNNTISPGNVVWKIKYPAKGVQALNWPALPIETDPATHDTNHVERNYWFVTEEAPGWSVESYNNGNALAPGVVSNTYYKDAIWYAAATKDHDDTTDDKGNTVKGATTIIQTDNKTKNAFMSVFSNGGEITNVPAIQVKGTKVWKNDSSDTRKDIWFHIDADYISSDGSLKRTVQDVLPPQRIAEGATGSGLTVTWGDHKTYVAGTTGKTINVKTTTKTTNRRVTISDDNILIISNLTELPTFINNRRVTWTAQANGSYKSNVQVDGTGVICYVNELHEISGDGRIEYKIRETLDKEGNQSVASNDAASGFIGYTTASDNVEWDDMVKTIVNENGVDVAVYSGTIENELELTDFTITKNWYDAKDDNAHNANELKTNITFYKDGTDATATYKDQKYGENLYYTDADGNEYEKVTAYKKSSGELSEKLPTVEQRNNERVHIAYTEDTSTSPTTWKDDSTPQNVYTEVTAYKKLSDGALTETQPANNGIDYLSITPGKKQNDGGSEVDNTKVWTYKIVKLPKYAKNATTGNVEEVVYSASETQFTGYKAPVYSGNVTTKTENVDDGSGNTTSVTTNTGVKDGGTIANIQLIKVNVVKIWDDADNQDDKRGDIEVKLFQNGEAYTTTVAGQTNAAELKKDAPSGKFATGKTEDNKYDTWTWSDVWTELPYAGDAGATYNYTAQETSMPGGYSNEQITLTGWNDAKDTLTFTATNKHDPDKVKFTVAKVWDDENDRDGKRPTNGAVTYTLKAQAAGESAATALTTLPAGAKITQGGNDITSSYTANGTITVNTDNGEGITIEGLDANAKVGKAITYSIEETAVTGYKTPEITGDRTSGFTVKNSRDHDTIQIKVVKTWNDDNNRDGKRADAPLTLYRTVEGSRSVTQLGGGDETPTTPVSYEEQKVESTTADGDTIVTWTVPVHDASGNAITYRVEEAAMEGYTTSYAVTGSSTGPATTDGSVDASTVTVGETATVTITNAHTPEPVDISAKKIWDDANDQDGIRKDQTATFTLKKEVDDGNGSKSNRAVEKDSTGADVTAKEIKGTDGDASVTWTDLYKYENGQEITYVVEETLNNGSPYTSSVEANADNTEYTFTNSYTPETAAVKVIKVWADSNNRDGKRPNTLSFTLTGKDKDGNDVVIADATKSDYAVNTQAQDGDDGSYEWANLPVYKDGVKIKYSVTEDTDLTSVGYNAATYSTTNVELTKDQTSEIKVTNSHTPETTDVTVTKKWVASDGTTLPTADAFAANLTLKAGSDAVKDPTDDTKNLEPTTATASANTYTYTWENLPKYKTGAVGREIAYTVEEAAQTGWTTTGSPAQNGGTITNTQLMQVRIVKTWDDANNRDDKRTEIKVTLSQNGDATQSPFGEKTLAKADAAVDNNANTWTWEPEKAWKDLPYADANGTPYNYTAVEAVLADYNGGQAVIVNRTVSNGTITFTMTNSRDADTTKVTATKVWSDSDNRDGKRQAVTLRLLADGRQVAGQADKTIVADATDAQRTVEWANLPVNKTKGATEDDNTKQSITYTVVEVEGTTELANDAETTDGYKVTYANDGNGNWTVTNSYTPETIKIPVKKVWDDSSNRDGARPTSVTFRLYADDADTGKTVELNAANDADTSTKDEWTLDDAFGNLPKYKDAGTEIVYAVKEDNPASITTLGYTIDESKGNKDNGYTITNSRTPDTVAVTVTKVWDDADNRDGIRPSEADFAGKLTLKAGDTPVDATPTITADASDSNKWTATWTGLPKNANGSEITYTVEEGTISGYTAEGSTTVSNNGSLTNKLTPATGKIVIKKIWDDASDQDGKRPDEIKVTLKSDNNPALSQEVTITKSAGAAANEWTSEEITNLPVYKTGKNGETVTYTIEETDAQLAAANGKVTGSEPKYSVKGYDPANVVLSADTVSTLTVTNTRTPEKIDIDVNKVWDDASDRDGMRPTEVQFTLTGKVLETIVYQVSKTLTGTGDEWKATFAALDKYHEGKEIAYTVIEEMKSALERIGYTADESKGNKDGSYTITNTYKSQDSDSKTVTRTITYTYITEDGEEASKTVTQTVKLTRTPKTVNPETGEVTEWNDWTIDSGDTSDVDSPDIDGWTPDKDNVPEWNIDLKDPKDDKVNVVYRPEDPTGTPDETYGGKGDSQTGTPTFDVTTPTTPDGSDNKIVEVKLVDPETGEPTDEKTVTVDEGTYTLNEDGTITFTPNDPEFVGDPTPVDVQGTDSNGKSTTTTYTPHVVDNTDTVTQTVTYEYADGTPVTDEDGNPITNIQKVTFTGTVNPKTGEVSFPEDNPDNTKSFDEVENPDIDGWEPDKTVGKNTVKPGEPDSTITVVYNPEGLKPTPDETYGLPGEDQTGTPTFTPDTPTLPDGTPNTIEEVKLMDPSTGEPTDTVTIPGQGTYKLNEDGTITFTPEDGFEGNPTPVGVIGKDKLGNTARTTYTPHIVNPTSTGTASRTIHYTYLTEDGTEVTKDTTQTVTLTRHAKKVDPKTGEVLEWGDWESATFPAVENPDKEAGEGWTTDDSVAELTVTEPGKVKDENVIYEPEKPEATPLVTKDGQFDSKDQSGNTTNTQKVNVNDSFKVGTPKMPDGSDNTFTYTLDIPKDADGKPVPGATVSEDGTTVTVPGEGTYKLDPKTGEITFTPDKEFSGKTSGVTVKGTDKFGNTAETTYTPIVVPNKETVTLEREVEYTFRDEDGNEVTEKRTETITFTRVGDYNPAKDDDPEGYGNDKDNPDENETIDFPAWTPKTSKAPENPSEEGWTPVYQPADITGLTPDTMKENGFTETEVPVTDEDGNPVYETDEDGNVVTDADGNPVQKTETKLIKSEQVVYTPSAPEATPRKTYGRIGRPQETTNVTKGMFTITTPTTDERDEDGKLIPNEIVKVTLINPDTKEPVEPVLTPVTDEDGKPVYETDEDGNVVTDEDGNPVQKQAYPSVPAYSVDEDGNRVQVGTYTYDPVADKVIFTPEPDFVGSPEPAVLEGTDKNGLSARNEYIPRIPDSRRRKTIDREITYVYDNGDGTTSPVLDENGEPLKVVQSATFTRDSFIDPDTGELLWDEWGPSSTELPEVVSPTEDDLRGGTGHTAKDLKGWTPDKNPVVGAEITIDPDTNELNEPDDVLVTYIRGPKGENDTSRGPKGQPQEGQPAFEKGTGTIPEKGAYSLEEHDEDNSNQKTVPGEGRYELDPDTGKVTFTPEPDFVGKAKGVTVKVTDENGLTATGKYTPTVYEKDDERTVTRTIHYRYLTKDGKEASADVVQSVKFVRKTDPNTGELGDWEIADGSATFTEVVSPEITGYEFDVEKIAELTVTPDSENTDEYVIYTPVKAPVPEPPKGTEDETWGAPGEEQTSTPEFKFTEGTGKIPEKSAYSLEDPDEDNPLKKTIPGEGTYELDPDTGKVTFTPEPDFRGKGTGVTVKVTDENGLSATGTYVPNVAENVDTTTVKRTITHEYADGTPVLDEDGKPVVTVQTVTFSRVGTVDPNTGEVTYPDWTEEKTLDEEKALERLLSTHTAVPDSVGELKVTGKSGDLTGKIVYTPIPDHTVTYIDNLTGEVITVDKNVPHHGDSTVPEAPAHDGYTFEGWRLPDGSIVKDLKVSDVTTDLVYEAVYKPVDPDVRTWTVTYVDSVTGEVIKVDKPVADHGSSAVPTPPEHDGYRFKGWLTPDGRLVTDLSVEDVTENLLYTAVYDRVYEEAVTIARTIHYRYLDKDGKEVVEDKIQDIRFTREAIVDGVTGETTFTEWNPRFHTFNPVESPEVEGWIPDRDVIEEQTVYPDGSNEELWVIYTPVEYSEQKELSRTVYYTYYTRDGEEASMPVKQTLKIERKYTIDPETKEKVYGEWYIIDEASEADIPEIEGFTPDLSEIPEFKVDLTVDEPVAPEDVHVVYNKVEDPEKITYTVTFVDGFGTTLKVQDGIDLHGTAEAPENPEHEGYRFTGWDVKFDDITGNIIVTALWEPIPETYWVTYVDPDGKTIYLEKTTVNKGEDEPEAPKDPVKDGFEFGGWDRSVDADGNITYTAIWKKPGEPDPTTTTTEEPTTTTTVVAEPTTAANPASPTVPVTGSAVRPTTVQNSKTGQSVTVVPAGTASPDTGDRNNAPVWIVIAIAAAGTAATAAIVRRRRRED